MTAAPITRTVSRIAYATGVRIGLAFPEDTCRAPVADAILTYAIRRSASPVWGSLADGIEEG